MKAAAAGGNKMATRMSRISEDLTIVAAVINRVVVDGGGGSPLSGGDLDWSLHP